MKHHSRLDVDLSAIEHNLEVFRSPLDGGDPLRVCAVLKKDAYGLGAVAIAHRLQRAGVEMIAVYSPDEARELIESGITTTILILMPVRSISRADPLYWSAVNERLHLTVHDIDQIKTLTETTESLGIRVRLHLELDTGIARGGMSAEEASSALQLIAAHPRLMLDGVYTHFACSRGDHAFTMKQHDRLHEWMESNRALIPSECLVHESNTFAYFRSGSLHGSMLRIGVGLLGYCGEELSDTNKCELVEREELLKPCVRWVTSVVHVCTIKRGQTVGYGALWRAKKKTRIALLPVGYADGYPMGLTNKGVVRFETGDGGFVSAPVIGRVSMDQITVDVTDIPEEIVAVGSPVEVFSGDRDAPNSLGRLAPLSKRLIHEILCGMHPRVHRSHLSLTTALDEEPTVAVRVVTTRPGEHRGQSRGRARAV
ncbi:MAG: alanine racemase [Phycisphaerales bacterium JB043]